MRFKLVSPSPFPFSDAPFFSVERGGTFEDYLLQFYRFCHFLRFVVKLTRSKDRRVPFLHELVKCFDVGAEETWSYDKVIVAVDQVFISYGYEEVHNIRDWDLFLLIERRTEFPSFVLSFTDVIGERNILMAYLEIKRRNEGFIKIMNGILENSRERLTVAQKKVVDRALNDLEEGHGIAAFADEPTLLVMSSPPLEYRSEEEEGPTPPLSTSPEGFFPDLVDLAPLSPLLSPEEEPLLQPHPLRFSRALEELSRPDSEEEELGSEDEEVRRENEAWKRELLSKLVEWYGIKEEKIRAFMEKGIELFNESERNRNGWTGRRNSLIFTSDGQTYYTRAGDMIPFFLALVSCVFYKVKRNVQDRVAKQNFGSVKLTIKFKLLRGYNVVRGRKVPRLSDADFELQLPRVAFLNERNCFRSYSDFLYFWAGPGIGKPKLNEVRRTFLEDHPSGGTQMGNMTDWWLVKFANVLGDDTWRYRESEINNRDRISDKSFYSCTHIKADINIVTRAVPRNSRRIRGTGIKVGSQNLFWEGMMKGWPKEVIEHMVFMKGETGCYERALDCQCVPFRVEPYFCECKDKVWKDVTVDQLAEKAEGKNLMVIGILIPTKAERKVRMRGDQPERKFYIVYRSDTFYTEIMPKVIFVNLPQWNRGARGHCAIWRGSYVGLTSDYDKFKELCGYNVILQKLCTCAACICPFCGEILRCNKLLDVHYNIHYKRYTCDKCGLSYNDEQEYQDHCLFHCKVPRYMAKITLDKELQDYTEKDKSKDRLIIYADLESAIDSEGKHHNILAGWCDNVNLVVHIHRSLEEMLEAWNKLKEKELQIYFHNGEGYDFHFMIKALCKYPPKDVDSFVLTCDSSEKIRFFNVRFKKHTLYFRDTFAFVSTSLEKWVKSTIGSHEGGKEAIIKGTTKGFPCFMKNTDRDKIPIIFQKNPFPYNAIRKAEDLELPFSKMFEWIHQTDAVDLFCGKYTIEELYEIEKWWRVNYTSLGWFKIIDYYRDYLTCDVSQLCDCMEFFAANVLSEYDLNVHEYYGIPGLTWAAWLKQNRYQLDALPDPKFFDIVNSSIRGGQTGAMTRYYDADEEPDTFVCDLDCNSLYPTVMQKFTYPCNDWATSLAKDDELINSNLSSEETYSLGVHYLKKGLDTLHSRKRSGFVELDLEVVDDERFYSYVPLASKRTVRGVYDYQAMAEYAALYETSVESMCFSGLTQVVGKHEHYCCHTRLLEWYLENDVIRPLHIYKVITGHDEPVFRDYVTHNLEMRKKYAADPIKKMLYKLFNNSLYGKTYEDVTDRCSYEMVRTDKLQSLIDIHRVVEKFGEWTLVETKNDVCEINKPIYLGACITEFSKLWMYKFFYNFIRPAFPNTDVLYTDTDALTIRFSGYGIKSMRDIAEKLNADDDPYRGIRQVIDTSEFNPLPLEEKHIRHNGEAGLFKSETGEGRIMKMIALRAKTYIMVCDDGTIKMSVKGCPMDEKKKLSFEEFKRVLFAEDKYLEIEYKAIRTERHEVYNRILDRIVLSADDRKRYIDEDKIHTYPLFSKKHIEALGKFSLPGPTVFHV